GDGLIGQAIADGRSFTLSPVPDGYLYFGSALGRAQPGRLLIAPARIDGQVNTVVELGSVGGGVKPAEAEELLARIAEQLGVAVRSAK
ncbi:GAF domain-containing protein, partial [Staphylococcus aureus]|uniref:GAF domain-containing protein n=1 Tax=Staphylococcus aureus TaxID=1280 RepID=UPI00190F400B